MNEELELQNDEVRRRESRKLEQLEVSKLDEYGKKVLDQLNPSVRNIPGVIYAIRNGICDQAVYSGIITNDRKEPEISVLDNGTRIVCIREAKDETYCTRIEIIINPERRTVTTIRIRGSYDKEKEQGVCECNVSFSDDQGIVGGMSTIEEFSCGYMPGRFICDNHRPDGLQYLQCHDTPRTIMPIRYVIEYRHEKNQRYSYEEGLYWRDEGQTHGKGVAYGLAGATRELRDGTTLVGHYDFIKQKLVFEPEIDASSIDEYLERKGEGKGARNM